jgi:hypothetical protein
MSDLVVGIIIGSGGTFLLALLGHEIQMYRQHRRARRRGGFVDHRRNRVGL